jgi:Ion transport protein
VISSDLDYVFNAVFMLEAVMKIIAFGWFLDENSYLTETWSQLDFFIVCCSVIDMSFSNINLPVIKVLRLLRILRPLRFISHNKNLKTIVIALLESLSGMVNVIIVVLLIWLMFGILGISLLGQRMGYCAIDDYYLVT